MSTRPASGTELLRQHIQQFVRKFGLLAEGRTPCGAPISPREAHALMVVLERERHDDPPRQNELAAELGIDKSNVTRLVQRLRSQGRVEQVASQEDGRARLLRLTPKGRRLAESIERASRRRFEVLLDGIPAAERKAVLAAVALLNEALDERSMEVEPHARV
jgi:DNA-binding MarR family transcriptional regulator